MPLKSLNQNPVAASEIGAILHSENRKLTICDIGARAGAASYWDCLGDSLHVVGFEPDKKECADLCRVNKESGYKFYPYAIHENSGRRKFMITNSPSSSGFDAIDPKFSRRFPTLPINNSVVSSINIDTISMDEFILGEGKEVDEMSFLKIDTEGSELAVLKGAKETLRKKKVLGIMVEVWWEQGIKQCPPFAELDTFLRSQGFHFFDLSLNYSPRITMPMGNVCFKKNSAHPNGKFLPMPDARGQATGGDAIYFRDPIRELSSGKRHIDWDEHTILRLAALFDIFNYGDCGIEILDFYRENFSSKIVLEELYDKFIQSSCGQQVAYDQFFEVSKDILKNKLELENKNINLDHIKKPVYKASSNRKLPDAYNKMPHELNEYSTNDKDVIAQLQEEVELLRNLNAAVNNQIKAIKNSNSWKVTSVFRWIVKQSRKL